MSSTQEMRRARQAVECILDELGLRAFLYTLQEKDAGWTLTVECASNGEWLSATLPAAPADLAASLEDPRLRATLRNAWAPHLQV